MVPWPEAAGANAGVAACAHMEMGAGLPKKATGCMCEPGGGGGPTDTLMFMPLRMVLAPAAA